MKLKINSVKFFLFILFTIQMAKSKSSKKKVVIIGEMSDIHDILNKSSYSKGFMNKDGIGIYDTFENYNRRRMQKNHYYRPQKLSSLNSVFVPVAAYSVTHRQLPSQNYQKSLARFKQFTDRNAIYKAAATFPGKTTQSAVYGYINRPDLLDFGSRYFYNQNDLDSSASMHSSYSDVSTAPLSPASLGMKEKTGGLGPGGLLLATLPLLLAPVLSYLFTPLVIPITATVAAGKRKKRQTQQDWSSTDYLINSSTSSQPLVNFHDNIQSLNVNQSFPYKSWKLLNKNDLKIKEIQVIAKYFQKVHFDESDRDRSVVKFLQCNGLLSKENHCLEKLACEFTDPSNYGASALDRSVTSILLDHILNNPYMNKMLKKNIESAALFGRHNKKKCFKYRCD